MPAETDLIRPLDVKQLLDLRDDYVIPIYQRNYAWELKEIGQLIQDVIDFSQYHRDKNYYIGTLVVAHENADQEQLSTIDGQQRLTTLAIITSVIKNEFPEVDVSWFSGINLSYASRVKSANSMEAVFEGVPHPEKFEPTIFSAYHICKDELAKKTTAAEISIAEFAAYLYRYVIILRVSLPQGIDLNHYFEIMNSRGEQLEKHEVLKAALMKIFNGFENELRARYETCFNLIWEACSNMERYVQYGFSTDARHLLFGRDDWNTLAVDDFDELVEKLTPFLAESNDSVALTIDQIIEGQSLSVKTAEKEDSPEKFNTVVNFPNFLLHILRVQTAANEVALDDKRLLLIFDEQLPKDVPGQLQFVKAFIYNLLKCKMLFDKYVIKREFTGGTDRWSLKSLTWYSGGKVKNGVHYRATFAGGGGDSYDGDNRRVLQLLSMFHTIIPSMPYKYWLNAALNYLFNTTHVTASDYITYLEHIAKSFVFDNYLAIKPKNYYELVYENLHPVKRNADTLDLHKLCYDGLQNNLVFNFLDYLLWSDLKDSEPDQRVKRFEFGPRSSVEHYYPQDPIQKDAERLLPADLHAFGNLCLISHEKNARLNNHMPAAKKDYYSADKPIDSVKQWRMMQYPHWGPKEIQAHNKQMTELLLAHMDGNFEGAKSISLAEQWFAHYRAKDPLLLVRALLCFDDCSKYTGGDRYNLSDLDFMHGSAAFTAFETYLMAHSPANLQELIASQLLNAELQLTYRYLFINYPELLAYCKNGNFDWFEAHDGRLLYLLASHKRTTYKTKEVYSYLIELFILNASGIRPFSNASGVYIKVGYKDGAYDITDKENERVLEVWIWNADGKGISHLIKPFVDGHKKAIKQLQAYGWVKNNAGKFERLGKTEMFKLGADNKKNAEGTIAAVKILLKNGLGIKL